MALREAEVAASRAAQELQVQQKVNHTLMHAKEKVRAYTRTESRTYVLVVLRFSLNLAPM